MAAPSTRQFYSGTHGNGFPACGNKFNVNDYELWTTASGFSHEDSGTPSAASIEESRRQAAKFMWTFYGVNGICANYNSSGITSANVVDHYTGSRATDGGHPWTRVCESSRAFVEGYDVGVSDSSNMSINTGRNVNLFYRGDPDDPSSPFLGYGIAGYVELRAASDSFGEVAVTLVSKVKNLAQFIGGPYTRAEAAVVDVNGMYFICAAEGSDPPSHAEGEVIIDAAGMEAYEVFPADEYGPAAYRRARIDSLEFFENFT